jgi:uncharacterized protein YuzE
MVGVAANRRITVVRGPDGIIVTVHHGKAQEAPDVTTMPLRVSYDPEVDAATVYFQEPRSGMSVHTKPLDDRRFIDDDEHGQVALVELHHVSEGVDFRGLPDPWRVNEALGRVAEQQGWASRLSA